MFGLLSQRLVYVVLTGVQAQYLQFSPLLLSKSGGNGKAKGSQFSCKPLKHIGSGGTVPLILNPALHGMSALLHVQAALLPWKDFPGTH